MGSLVAKIDRLEEIRTRLLELRSEARTERVNFDATRNVEQKRAAARLGAAASSADTLIQSSVTLG